MVSDALSPMENNSTVSGVKGTVCASKSPSKTPPSDARKLAGRAILCEWETVRMEPDAMSQNRVKELDSLGLATIPANAGV